MPFDTAALTKKVGPLPVWSYGAIVAALVWAYYWWTHRDGTTPDTGTGYDFAAPDATDSGLDFTDNTGIPANTGGSSTGAQSGVSTPGDNLAWLQAAANYLVGFNYESVAVNNALTKYLTGEQLTTSERAMVNQAIARFGIPPEGVPVSPGPTPSPIPLPGDDRPGTPTPTPLPGTPAPPKPIPRTKPAVTPAYSTVTVKKWVAGNVVWDSTMWGIAKHFGYGSSSSNYVPIWNDSKNAALKSKRKDPGLIRAGDIVYVKAK